MKNIFIALFCLFCASANFAQFNLPATTVAKPEAKITKFTLEAISLKDITFLFELSVKNPYPVDLSFSGMSLDFLVENSSVFKVKDQGGFTVAANKQSANTFTVVLSYENIGKILKDYEKKDSLKTKIKGNLTIPLPKIAGLPKDISFDYELDKIIPTLKPQVALTNFTVKGPSIEEVNKGLLKAASKVDAKQASAMIGDLLSGKKVDKPVIKVEDIDVPISINFTIAISNAAPSPLGLKSLKYKLSLDGIALLDAESTTVRIQDKTTFIDISSKFSTKNLSAALQKLFAKKSGSFEISASAALVVPKEIRDTPIPLSFKEIGNFSF